MEKETKNKVELPSGVTSDMIKEWKEKYGAENVKLATLYNGDDKEDTFDAVLKVPTRQIISEFEKFQDRNPDKAKEIMVNGCFLTEKERIKSKDGYFLCAFNACVKLLPVAEAVVKNL